ncbi:MAG: hypothetical protein HC821_02855 [Lewinella sp.]|nr:hypothetical protein [Lewinella sp.]
MPTHLAVLAVAAAAVAGQNPSLLRVGLLQGVQDQPPTPLPLFHNDRKALLQYWRRPDNLLAYAIPIQAAQQQPPPQNWLIIEDFAWLCQLLARFPLIQLPEYTVLNVLHQNNRTHQLLDLTWLAARREVVHTLYSDLTVGPQLTARHYRSMLTHQTWHCTRQWVGAGAWRIALSTFMLGLRTFTIFNTRELLYTLFYALRTYSCCWGGKRKVGAPPSR